MPNSTQHQSKRSHEPMVKCLSESRSAPSVTSTSVPVLNGSGDLLSDIHRELVSLRVKVSSMCDKPATCNCLSTTSMQADGFGIHNPISSALALLTGLSSASMAPIASISLTTSFATAPAIYSSPSLVLHPTPSSTSASPIGLSHPLHPGPS